MLLRPELRGNHGAVASTHWLASAAGVAMLDRGGNAFDAAAAAAFVIQVVEPHLNGPAGDVSIVLHEAASGTVRVVCGQGPMPAAATIAAFRDRGLPAIPGSGLLPACVPGVFGAWMRVLAEYGRLPLAEILAPAIGYAEDGYPLPPRASAMINTLTELFREEWQESGRTYLRNGAAPRPWERTSNPVLATTFRRLVKAGRAGGRGREAQLEAATAAFYQGFVAAAIDRFVATSAPIDATGRHQRGLLTAEDLATWRPTIEEPVSLRYRDYLVHKPGPWSQGPVFLQQVALLEGFDLGAMGFGSADHLHTVVESAKLAFADRDAWYGDPAVAEVPMQGLLDYTYTAARRKLIGAKAANELTPGQPEGKPGWIPVADNQFGEPTGQDWLSQLRSGIPTVLRRTATSGDTCFISAADRDGNLIAATPSGGWLKSSPVVPGLGFPLGTRGQMAWLVEGHPNSLAPSKRPRTTLSPTLVSRDGRPYLAFGTPGGDQQDQWTLNFLLNHVDFGMGVQAAAEAFTFHTEHLMSSFAPRKVRHRTVVVEAAIEAVVVDELRVRGHEVKVVEARSLGRVCATGIQPAGGVIAAVSPRDELVYAVAR